MNFNFVLIFFFKFLLQVILKYIFGRIGLYFGGFVEKLNYFRDLGSKGKILSGSWGFYSGVWEIMALFVGSKGAQTPPPGGLVSVLGFFLLCDGISWLYSLIF